MCFIRAVLAYFDFDNLRSQNTDDLKIMRGINATINTYGCLLVLVLSWKKNRLMHWFGLLISFIGIACYSHDYDLSKLRIVNIFGYILGAIFLKMQFTIFFDYIEAVYEESVIKLEQQKEFHTVFNNLEDGIFIT